MSDIRKGHVEAGGVRYGYEIHGAGDPLLILHGGDVFLRVTGFFLIFAPAGAAFADTVSAGTVSAGTAFADAVSAGTESTDPELTRRRQPRPRTARTG